MIRAGIGRRSAKRSMEEADFEADTGGIKTRKTSEKLNEKPKKLRLAKARQIKREIIDDNDSDSEPKEIPKYNTSSDTNDVSGGFDDDNNTGSATPMRPNATTLNDRNVFSINSRLNGYHKKDPIESLKMNIYSADLTAMGTDIREGIKNGTLNDVQLMEVANSLPPPNLSITHFVDLIENASTEDMKSIMVAQHFVGKMKSEVESTLTKVKANLDSLSSSYNKQYNVAAVKRTQLTSQHVSPAVGAFRSLNLNQFCVAENMPGDKSVNQLTNLYSAVLRSLLPNEYDIWVYSYRPICPKNSDKNFKPLPKQVVESLKDFGYDVLGCFLPVHLLAGPIPSEDEFVQRLGTNAMESILHRRNVRAKIDDVIKIGLNFALQNLRNYHFDIELERLVYCSARKQCMSHLRWDDVKSFRERRRSSGLEVDHYSIEEVMRMARRSASEPVGELEQLEPYVLEDSV